MVHSFDNQKIISKVKEVCKKNPKTTLSDLLNQLKITKPRLVHLLSRNNIKIYSIKHKNKDMTESILSDKTKLTIKQYSEKFGVSLSTIRRIFNLNNIPLDSGKTIQHNYFHHIDSYEKAYVLGIWLTDGSVDRKYNRMSISLTQNDAYILERIHRIVGAETEILYTGQRGQTKPKCYIAFSSAQMKKDLADFSIVPNKTFKTKFPDIKSINEKRGLFLKEQEYEKIYAGFILGLLDGDGYFTFTTGYSRLVIGFLGTINLLDGVNKYISEKIGVSFRNVRVHTNGANIYRIEWTKKDEVKKIVKHLYGHVDKKADLFMKRKYKKALGYLGGSK